MQQKLKNTTKFYKIVKTTVSLSMRVIADISNIESISNSSKKYIIKAFVKELSVLLTYAEEGVCY